MFVLTHLTGCRKVLRRQIRRRCWHIGILPCWLVWQKVVSRWNSGWHDIVSFWNVLTSRAHWLPCRLLWYTFCSVLRCDLLQRYLSYSLEELTALHFIFIGLLVVTWPSILNSLLFTDKELAPFFWYACSQLVSLDLQRRQFSLKLGRLHPSACVVYKSILEKV